MLSKIAAHIKSEWYKYVLEILVVIFGIIVAFKLERWNDEQELRKVEISILKEVKDGLAWDLREIQTGIARQREAIKSCETILMALDQNSAYHDSLDVHFSKSHQFHLLIENIGPYEVLKSKGFEIISNDSIRVRIENTYSRDYKVIHEFERLMETTLNRLIEFEKPYFDKVEFFGRMKPTHFDQLKSQGEYKFHLRSLISMRTINLGFNTGEEKWFQTVIDNVKDEISRLENK